MIDAHDENTLEEESASTFASNVATAAKTIASGTAKAANAIASGAASTAKGLFDTATTGASSRLTPVYNTAIEKGTFAKNQIKRIFRGRTHVPLGAPQTPSSNEDRAHFEYTIRVKHTYTPSTPSRSQSAGGVIVEVSTSKPNEAINALESMLQHKSGTVRFHVDPDSNPQLLWLYQNFFIPLSKKPTLRSFDAFQVQTVVNVNEQQLQGINDEINQLGNTNVPNSRPVTVTVPSYLPVVVPTSHIEYYQLSDQFTDNVVGDHFFHMQLRSRTESEDGQFGSGKLREEATEMNPIPIVHQTSNDNPVHNELDLIYSQGNKRYAKHVTSFVQEMMQLAAVGSVVRPLASMALSGRGGRIRKRNTRRSRLRFTTQHGTISKTRYPTTARRRTPPLPRAYYHTQHNRPIGSMAYTLSTKRSGGAPHVAAGRLGVRTRKQLGGGVSTSAVNALVGAVGRLLGSGTPSGNNNNNNTDIPPNNAPTLSSSAPTTAADQTTTPEQPPPPPPVSSPSITNRLVSTSVALAAAAALRHITSISPAEHRSVWGNQVQDYIRYKGVFVGEPVQFFFDCHEFESHTKKALVYYFRFKLEKDLHPDHLVFNNLPSSSNPRNRTPPPANSATAQQSYDFACTHDFVPVVVEYKKSTLQVAATGIVGGVEQLVGMSAPAIDGLLGNNTMSSITGGIRNLTNQAGSMLEQQFSYIKAPSKSNTEFQDRQKTRFHQLNRLTQQNEMLLQETMLHSMSSMRGRRFDMYFCEDDSGEISGANQFMNFLISVFATRGSADVFGLLLKLVSFGEWGISNTLKNAVAVLAAGGTTVTEHNKGLVGAFCGQFMQTVLKCVVPAITHMFPTTTLIKVFKKHHATLSGNATHSNSNGIVAMLKQFGAPVLPQMWSTLPSAVWTKDAGIYLEDIRNSENSQFRAIRVLMDQFSHNWAPLHDKTKCHFMYTSNLSMDAGVVHTNSISTPNLHSGVRSDGSGVVLAFELGAEYRQDDVTIQTMLKWAFAPKSDPGIPSNGGVPWKERVRVMLFGHFHTANMEYETYVAEELMRLWAGEDAYAPLSETGATLTLDGGVNLFGDGDLKENTHKVTKYLEKVRSIKSWLEHRRLRGTGNTDTNAATNTGANTGANTGGGKEKRTKHRRHGPSIRRSATQRKGGAAAGTGSSSDDNFDELLLPPSNAELMREAHQSNQLARDRVAYRSGVTEEKEGLLREHTIRVLLKMLAAKCPRIPTNMTVHQFRITKYSAIADHVFGLAIIPFGQDHAGNRCAVHYDTNEATTIGPFVFGTENTSFVKYFKDLGQNTPTTETGFGPFCGQYLRRLQEAHPPTTNAEVRKARLKVLNLKWLYTFAEFNTRSYEFDQLVRPKSEEEKFKKCVEKYRKYLSEKAQIVKQKEAYAAQEYLNAEKQLSLTSTDQQLVRHLTQTAEGVLPGQYWPRSRRSIGRRLSLPTAYWQIRDQTEQQDLSDIPRRNTRRNTFRHPKNMDGHMDPYEEEQGPFHTSEGTSPFQGASAGDEVLGRVPADDVPRGTPNTEHRRNFEQPTNRRKRYQEERWHMLAKRSRKPARRRSSHKSRRHSSHKLHKSTVPQFDASSSNSEQDKDRTDVTNEFSDNVQISDSS
jgi:hypothetical protein